jgi:hypothetical protein
VFDVANHSLLVIRVANEGVKIIFGPELAGAFQSLVGFERSKLLPIPDNLRQRNRVQVKHHVNVIPHHNPGAQPVPFAVEMEQSTFHK